MLTLCVVHTFKSEIYKIKNNSKKCLNNKDKLCRKLEN